MARMGVSVKEMRSEAKVATVTTTAKGERNLPASEDIVAMGRKTTTLVRAEAATARAT